jgi:acyl dehydratase
VKRTYLEDVRVGESRTFGTYVLTQDEIVEFATKWDPQPFHTDPEAAKDSVFGELVACAAHLFAVIALLVTHAPEPNALLAGLASEEMRLQAPGRPGDVLHLRRTYLEARPSASRPEAGVVRQLLELIDDDGRVLVAQRGAILVSRRPH